MADSSSLPALVLREEGPVLHVLLNRPEKLNALDPAMIAELRILFETLRWRTDIRVVVLRGAGRGFCAGLDLVGTGAKTSERSILDALQRQREISQIIVAMRRCPQPIVALVNGPASGGGFALALAADIRIGTPTMRMNAAFIRVGLSGCDIGISYFLPRMIGAARASHYMMTGRFIGGEDALAMGLVSEIVDESELDAAGGALVSEMLRATPLGLGLTKEALGHAIDGGSLESVVALEDRNQILASRGPDFAEGVAAFLEKREPRFASS